LIIIKFSFDCLLIIFFSEEKNRRPFLPKQKQKVHILELITNFFLQCKVYTLVMTGCRKNSEQRVLPKTYLLK